MTKGNCRQSSSSSCSKSSSSSSSVSEDCCAKGCKGLSAREIFCKFKSAVVAVQSETILTVAAPGVVPVFGTNAQSVFMSSNGFLIKKHYIICPAHVVLIPPSVLNVNQRYPFVAASPVVQPTSAVGGGVTGIIPNYMTKVSRILVTVYDVNRCCDAFVYEADLIGVDGAGDVAILKINHKRGFNQSSPKLSCKCHPYLKWAKSRKMVNGDKIYAIGNAATHWRNYEKVDEDAIVTTDFPYNTSPVILTGTLQDNRYVDYIGWTYSELFLADLNVSTGKSGLPVLDVMGYVIGMQTTNKLDALQHTETTNNGVADGFVAGPTEFFMRPIIKALLSGPKTKYGNHLETVADATGSFLRYTKAYLGLGADVVQGLTYDTTINTTTGTLVTRLDAQGNFLNSPACKKIIGLRVISVAGDTAVADYDFAYTPGATASVTAITGFDSALIYPGASAAAALANVNIYGSLDILPNSSVLGQVLPGDIITHLNKCPLGDLCNQVAPALNTWLKKPGDRFELSYRKASEQLEVTHTIHGTYGAFPKLMDYPWYKVQEFSELSTAFGINAPPYDWPYQPGLTFHPAF